MIIINIEDNRELWEHPERLGKLWLVVTGNLKVVGHKKLQKCVDISADAQKTGVRQKSQNPRQRTKYVPATVG